MTQQLARIAGTLQKKRTGVAPKAVTAILSENTLVVTLDNALTPAERAVVRTPRAQRKCKSITDNYSPVRVSRCKKKSRGSPVGRCEKKP